MTSKPLVEVALKLTGSGFLPEEATALIQLAPTKTWRLGDPVQGSRLKRKNDGWVFGLPQRPTFDMDGLLRELLDAIEPYKEKIADFVQMFSLIVEVSFGLYIDGETPACLFTCDTISRLASLQASLDIDLILIG